MRDLNLSFGGSLPQNYDKHLGPLLFAPYAEDMAAKVAIAEGKRVLEVACGTGILTRSLNNALPASVSIVATDISPQMIEYAQGQLHSDRVEWRVANGLELPFDNASFDTIVSQFGFMFFPDKLAGFAEARRVLAPGGLLCFSVWADLASNVAFKTMNETMSKLYPDDADSFAKTPFNMEDPDVVVSDLKVAGFSDVSFEVVSLNSPEFSPSDLATGFTFGTPVNNYLVNKDVNLAQVQKLLELNYYRKQDDPNVLSMKAIVYRGVA